MKCAAATVRSRDTVYETGQLVLLDQVGQRIAPGFTPCAEALFANRAVPFGAVGANAKSSQHVAVLGHLGMLVRRRQSVRTLLDVVAAVTPGTARSVAMLHCKGLFSAADVTSVRLSVFPVIVRGKLSTNVKLRGIL